MEEASPPSFKFEVRPFYHALFLHVGSLFYWKSIWCGKVSLRVAFFVWTSALGRILTLNNLRKRSFIVVDWYCMGKGVESP